MFKSIKDVIILEQNKMLGEGAFSTVIKIKLKNDGKIYALKKIDANEVSKEDLLNLQQEIQLHKSIQNEYIIHFYDNIQETNMVYLLLEYAGNGNLFFYIHSLDGIPEKLALRFFYQTALAVQYLHDRNIIHRDIKPENILLDQNFNVKLCDLGWGCVHDDGFRKSICGTYEYMSPEIVLKRQHNNKVDIWCLGILLYEMLHGNPPFEAENFDDIYNEMKNFNVMIREDLEPDTKAIMQYMLKTNEHQRYSIDQVLNHPSITKNVSEFMKPLTEKEKAILLRNYLLNNGDNVERTLPDSLLDLLDKNPSLKQNKEPKEILNAALEYINKKFNFERHSQRKKLINLNCQIPNKTQIVQEIDYDNYLKTGVISFKKKKTDTQDTHQIALEEKLDFNRLLGNNHETQYEQPISTKYENGNDFEPIVNEDTSKVNRQKQQEKNQNIQIGNKSDIKKDYKNQSSHQPINLTKIEVKQELKLIPQVYEPNRYIQSIPQTQKTQIISSIQTQHQTPQNIYSPTTQISSQIITKKEVINNPLQNQDNQSSQITKQNDLFKNTSQQQEIIYNSNQQLKQNNLPKQVQERPYQNEQQQRNFEKKIVKHENNTTSRRKIVVNLENNNLLYRDNREYDNNKQKSETVIKQDQSYNLLSNKNLDVLKTYPQIKQFNPDIHINSKPIQQEIQQKPQYYVKKEMDKEIQKSKTNISNNQNNKPIHEKSSYLARNVREIPLEIKRANSNVRRISLFKQFMNNINNENIQRYQPCQIIKTLLYQRRKYRRKQRIRIYKQIG